MSSCKRLALALTLFVSSMNATPALAAGPSSLNYATKTDFWSNDMRRIHHLSNSLAAVGGRLQYHLYSLDAPGLCQLSMSCNTAATDYIAKINSVALELSTKVSTLYDVSTAVRDAKMAQLRVSHIDEMARLQYGFLQSLPFAGHDPSSTTGSGLADIECRDYFAIYWMLMTRVVDYPREAGLGGGRGTDD